MEYNKKTGKGAWSKSADNNPDARKLRCKKQNEQLKKYRKRHPFKKLIHDIRGRCVKTGEVFQITDKDIEQLHRPTHCPILGMEIIYPWEPHKPKANELASIDRFIPELGYIVGNIGWISFKANRLKSDHTVETLEKVLIYLKENKNNEESQKG